MEVTAAVPVAGKTGCTRWLGATLDGAVVSTVSVTLAVVVVELNVTIVGETPQLLSVGSPVHCGVRLNVPLSPFIAVSVSIVLPDAPGRATVIVAGFATTLKSGAAVIVTVVLPDDPVYAVSPG